MDTAAVRISGRDAALAWLCRGGPGRCLSRSLPDAHSRTDLATRESGGKGRSGAARRYRLCAGRWRSLDRDRISAWNDVHRLSMGSAGDGIDVSRAMGRSGRPYRHLCAVGHHRGGERLLAGGDHRSPRLCRDCPPDRPHGLFLSAREPRPPPSAMPRRRSARRAASPARRIDSMPCCSTPPAPAVRA